MKATSTENYLLDQLFKISKSDENISNYLIDCGSPFNCEAHNKESESLFNGVAE